MQGSPELVTEQPVQYEGLLIIYQPCRSRWGAGSTRCSRTSPGQSRKGRTAAHLWREWTGIRTGEAAMQKPKKPTNISFSLPLIIL